MRDREFYKSLRGLMIPIAFQSFMLAAVSAGDSAMLGFVDENAMAAVSLAGNIQFVENLFLSAIVCGGTILTSQYWGKGDKKAVEWLFGLIIRYAAVVSAVFFAAAIAFPEVLMSFFTDEAELLALGAQYVRVAALSYLLTGVTQCWLCVMKTTGQTKQSAAISTGALALDTALNAVFIFGLGMGVLGAALTTAIARLAELAAALLYTRRMAVRPDFRRTSRALNRDFVRYSAPVLVNAMVWGIGTTLYSVIIGHLGTVMAAANAVAGVVRQLAISVCRGLASGGEILLAGVLGSGDLLRGREYGRRLAVLSVLCGAACAGLALAFGLVLLRLMALSDAVRQTLLHMTVISALYMLPLSVNTVVICGVFTAGGDTAFDAYSVAVTMWLMILPAACAAAFWWRWEPMTVYLILSLDEIIKIPWVYAHYKKHRWLRNITREDAA